MELVWHDLRYGARTLIKTPGFTLVAVFTLALGIGANTIIFSVVDRVLLRPLNYVNPDQLVMIWEQNLKKGWSRSHASFANLLDYKDTAESVEIAGFTDTSFNLTGGEQPERVSGLRVSANLFSVLGVNPLLGRWFTPQEDKPGADRVLILSYGLWQRSFGGNPNLLNQTVHLNGQSYTVVGVMPPSFQFPPSFSVTVSAAEETIANANLWVPLTTDNVPLVRDIRIFKMIGRLKPGVTAQQAQEEINAIAKRLDKEYPDANAGIESHVIPLHEQVTGDVRRALYVLMGAVGLVLLMACANVANLLLAKATNRKREIAIRSALGANRFRLLRQLLIESALLGLLGGLLGLVVAIIGLKVLKGFVTVNIPQAKDLTFSSSALLFAFAVSLLTSLVFGLVPAIHASKSRIGESLKEGGRSSWDSSANNRLRSSIVIAQVTLAVVLLTASGLLIRSFVRLRHINPGFNPENLLTLEIELPETSYSTGEQQRAFQQQLLQRIQLIPGVVHASTVDYLPFSGNAFNSSFTIEGRPIPVVTERPRAFYRVISADYFSTMGISLQRGKQFNDGDSADAQGVAIINAAAARKYWPNEDPLGKRIKRGRPESANPWVSIVGIVGSAKQLALGEDTQPEIYLPYLQNTTRNLTLVARTAPDPQMVARAIRTELSAAEKGLPVSGMKLMDELISNSLAQPRFNVILLTVFAGFALILTALGVYGVVSYSVRLRTHDIGIRIAVGARPRDILRYVVGEALLLTLIGLAIGIVAAVAVTRMMRGLLYGISPTDALTLTTTSLLLLAMALIASYIPALRAMRIDPMVTLRYE